MRKENYIRHSLLHDSSLKESIPHVIKSSPETNIDANWLKTELLDSLEILSNCGFRVRAIVCDNHPSNVSSFKKLLEDVNQNPDEFYMLHKSRKMYLCYDAVNVSGGEIAWKTFHDVFERDAEFTC